jgi:magnesium-transporting ATPase (P-type)
VLRQLGVDPKAGLSDADAQKRLSQYGPSALEEKKKSQLAVFLGFFWGPIPWMIEAAALMALLVKDLGDFTIITALLVFNAILGFWEEHQASNALAALKGALAGKARVLRGGQWREADAATLVPGDTAFDHVPVAPKPVTWDMPRILTISSIFGSIAVVQSFGLMYIGDIVWHIDRAHLQTMMFLQLVAGGHLMLFVTRTPEEFWKRPFPAPKLFWAIVAMQILRC